MTRLGWFWIVMAVLEIWFPVPHLVVVLTFGFVAVLCFAVGSRRVHIDPPGKKKELP